MKNGKSNEEGTPTLILKSDRPMITNVSVWQPSIERLDENGFVVELCPFSRLLGFTIPSFPVEEFDAVEINGRWFMAAKPFEAAEMDSQKKSCQ
jgi:hypothetical protein